MKRVTVKALKSLYSPSPLLVTADMCFLWNCRLSTILLETWRSVFFYQNNSPAGIWGGPSMRPQLCRSAVDMLCFPLGAKILSNVLTFQNLMDSALLVVLKSTHPGLTIVPRKLRLPTGATKHVIATTCAPVTQATLIPSILVESSLEEGDLTEQYHLSTQVHTPSGTGQYHYWIGKDCFTNLDLTAEDLMQLKRLLPAFNETISFKSLETSTVEQRLHEVSVGNSS
eukprot:TRINITY_DN4223_c0_g1_i1.p1 TRINITY_DN4223_c0_g1~~TRINITY_DN4223_c0_g1_i1.p1  ORF type:complete len:227 (-),score=17.60 TRINITY_DN4223_c0_g1_i1:556-1236(-)